MVYANKCLLDLLGVSSLSELKNHKITDFYANPGQREGVIQQLLKEGKLSNVEIKLQSTDKRIIWGLINVTLYRDGENLAYIDGSIEDITTKHIIESGLDEDKLMMLQAIESLPGILYLYNKDGKLIKWSKELENVTGYTWDEMKSMYQLDFIPDTEKPYIAEEISKVLSEGQTTIKSLLLTKSGEEIPYCYSAIKMTFNNSDYLLGVGFDISEEKRQEETLRQVHKLEAIGTMAGGIAHDFNNILGVIIGFTDLLLHNEKKGGQAKRELEQIFSAAQRATQLVKQIIAFSKQSDVVKQCVDIVPIINEALNLIRASIPSDVCLEKNITVNEALIFSDPIQIHEILMNLCNNAKHAMKEGGGTLTLSLKETENVCAEAIAHSDMKLGQYYCLSITDTGVGISPDIVDKIFDPFFSTKSKDEGTGLGLSVVHGIVESYHGTISVDSIPGERTTFAVCLPKHSKELVGEADDINGVPFVGGHILCVDDEPVMLKLLSDMLKTFGYTCETFLNGNDAFAAFINAPDKYDCVVTDQIMSKMSGLELLQCIKAECPTKPVVICTGFSDTVDIEHARAQGVDEILFKPILPKVFKASLRQLIVAHKGENNG